MEVWHSIAHVMPRFSLQSYRRKDRQFLIYQRVANTVLHSQIPYTHFSFYYLTVVSSFIITNGPILLCYWLKLTLYSDFLNLPNVLTLCHIAFCYHVFLDLLGCGTLSIFPYFWWPGQLWGVLVRYFVEWSAVGIWGLSWLKWDHSFWK